MQELNERQKEKIGEICRNFGLPILLLFGSQVSGKTHGESDIDLAFAAPDRKQFSLPFVGEFCGKKLSGNQTVVG